MNKDILSYAIEFVSFLIGNLEQKELGNIKEIIVFGSVARGTAEKGSDVDIFINVISENGIEGRIEKIKEDFYKTEVFKKWKLKGVENEFKIIIDRLEKWKDLQISIISDGFVLFSKYKSQIEGEQQVLLYWDKIGNSSKRVLLSKKLYGYTYKNSRYKGLIELTGSVKLGTNCIMVKLEDSEKIIETFESLGIQVKRIYLNRL